MLPLESTTASPSAFEDALGEGYCNLNTTPAENSACHTANAWRLKKQNPGAHKIAVPPASMKVPNKTIGSIRAGRQRNRRYPTTGPLPAQLDSISVWTSKSSLSSDGLGRGQRIPL